MFQGQASVSRLLPLNTSQFRVSEELCEATKCPNIFRLVEPTVAVIRRGVNVLFSVFWGSAPQSCVTFGASASCQDTRDVFRDRSERRSPEQLLTALTSGSV